MADETTQTPAPAPVPDSIPIDLEPSAAPASIPIDLNPTYGPTQDKRAPFLKTNLNPTGPTIQEAHKPLTQRVKEAVTENIPQFSQRTVNDPNYGKESFLPDSDVMTQEERRAAPVAAGALDVASEVGSPATIGTIAATAGLGEAPAIVSKVASALFAGQIAKSVYDQYPALQAAVDKAQHAKSQQEHDDAFADAQKILTHMGVDTAFGLLAAKHGAEGAKDLLDATTGSGVPDQASTFKAPEGAPRAPEPEETHPEYNRATVKELQKLGYSMQHITQFNITEIRDILKNQTPAAEYKFPNDSRQWSPNQPAGPDPDAFSESGGKLVGPQPKTEAVAEKPGTVAITPTKILAEKNGVTVPAEDLIMADKVKPSGSSSAILWHGTPSGDLRGGTTGLHVGTRAAAEQALEARIGIRADGKPWDGTQEYGKTLLAGTKTLAKLDPSGNRATGYNAYLPLNGEDHYSTGATYSDGTEVDASAKPNIIPVKIKGAMTNTPATAISDSRANSRMRTQLNKGTATKGVYYKNEGEDVGSISAALPGPDHIEQVIMSDKIQGKKVKGATSKPAAPPQQGRRAGVGGIGLTDPEHSSFAADARTRASGRKNNVGDMGSGGKAWLNTDGTFIPQDGIHRDGLENLAKGNIRIGNLERDGSVLFHANAAPTEAQRAGIGKDLAKQGVIYDLTNSKGERISGETDKPGEFWRTLDKFYGTTPDPNQFAEHGGKFIGQQPTAAPAQHPTVVALKDKFGKTTNPEAMVQGGASFLHADGTVTNIGGSTHPEAIATATGNPKGPGDVDRTGFINETGSIRVRNRRMGKAGPELVFSVPEKGVTPHQADMMKQAVGKMGRNGNLLIEAAHEGNEPSDTVHSWPENDVKEFATPRDVDTMLQKIGAHPDQKDLVTDELHTPHKETYGMEITDAEGKVQNVPIEAHSSKQALDLLVKKFPEAHKWRLATAPEEKAPATDYSVPAGKIQKMKASAARPEIHTIRHELGHALVGQKEGLVQGGMLSSSHPDMSRDARAAVLWPGRDNVLWSAPGKIRSDKVAPVVRTMMGGIAADELFNDLHRAANRNFDLDAGGDGTNAYKILRSAGANHEKAIQFMHDAIDYDKDYLTQPGVSSVIHENAGVREEGLSRQFHASPERLSAMHQESQRRIANGKNQPAKINDNGATGSGGSEISPADVASGKSGSPQGTGESVPEKEDLGLTKGEEDGIVSEEKIKKAKDSEELPEVAPNKKLQASAQRYAKAQGMAPINHEPVEADSARAREIAKIYEESKHEPNNPRVKAAYDALKSETLSQFHHLRDDLGLKFKPQEEDPYNSAEQMMDDIRKNNTLKVFTGSSTGEDHPLSAIAPGTGGQSYNTVFRWVHDAMGHAAGGNDFSENGEKSATEAHAQMYSDTARPAMRNETEGQTSWFFHSPEVESGAKQPSDFAEQKAALIHEVSHDWHETIGKAAAEDEAGGINPRTGKSDTMGIGTEILPEFRQPLGHAPTPADFQKFYDRHKDLFDQHPELRVGFDNMSAVEGGHEINIGAVGPNAAKVAAKLDQKSAFDIKKGEVIPTGGSGLKTDFKDYPLEDRIKDLKSTPTRADKLAVRAQRTIAKWRQSAAFDPSDGGTPQAPAAPPAPKGSENIPTVSTRTPSIAANKQSIENHSDNSLTSDMQAAAAAPGFLKKLADRVSDIPGFIDPGGDDHEARTNAYIRHVADNTKFVQSKVTPEEHATDSQWYPVGAHERGIDVAKKHGLDVHQAYAITAALSPLTDWDQNTAQAERAAEIWKNQQDTKFDTKMRKAADEILTVPAMEHFRKVFKSLEGKKLGELKTEGEQAWWLRLYEEGHYDRSFQTWNPDGTSAGLAMNADGVTPKSMSWSFQSLIENAISIMKDGSPENISRALGEGHKVRNFYNNQLSPDDPRFLTVDTHQVNIGQLRPMSGSYPDVSDNFGTPTNAPYGLSGTYVLHDAGTRLAAKELGIDIPSRLQSSGWVKIRKVFPNKFKTEENLAVIDAIWKEHTDGKITADDARNRIWDFAEGWNRDAARKVRNPSDSGELSEPGVRGETSEANGRGDRSDAAEEVSEPGVDDTSFDFGANEKPVVAASRKSKGSEKSYAKKAAEVQGLIEALHDLKTPGKK